LHHNSKKPIEESDPDYTHLVLIAGDHKTIDLVIGFVFTQDIRVEIAELWLDLVRVRRLDVRHKSFSAETSDPLSDRRVFGGQSINVYAEVDSVALQL
jgi:hypothetical protein